MIRIRGGNLINIRGGNLIKIRGGNLIKIRGGNLIKIRGGYFILHEHLSHLDLHIFQADKIYCHYHSHMTLGSLLKYRKKQNLRNQRKGLK